MSSRAEKIMLPPDFGDAVADVAARLEPLGRRFEFFSTIGSTNDVASRHAASGDHEGAVFVADTQTAGRGRRGRTWFSPPGAGLYVSTILRPSRSRESARAVLLTTIAAGVALVEGVRRATGLAPSLKWPNDLYVGKRKLAGILAEGIGDSVVLGYGINVGAASLPPELGDRATSLETELGRSVDRARVFAETLAALAARYDDLLSARFDAILDAWRALAPSAHGARVSWTTPAGERNGVTGGIDDQGALLVRCDDGIERIVAGELVWR
jgi:BirA family transcriptional regulator, biotin operon repressor / biotin---[acetyl-CoA-carboxylase] ligase